MTPTLYGRWQTRLLLMTVLGMPLTLLYIQLSGQSGQSRIPFTLLGFAMLLGLGWDLLYGYIQSLRWNRDWPPLFALYAGLWEGSCLFMLTQLSMPWQVPPALTWLPKLPMQVTIGQFWMHYGIIFAAVYLASLGLMHVLNPRWRYRGGQWV